MGIALIRSVVACLVASMVPAAAAAPPATLPAPPQPFPVLAWHGVPENHSTAERHRELAECGFNVNFAGFSSADANARAIDVAKAAGVKLMVACPQLQSDLEATVKRFKDHAAHGGYYLRDEPAAVHFPELAQWADRIRAADPDSDAKRPCYVNLFPNYAEAAQLGTNTYGEYVDRFIRELRLPMVSFDHYPVISDGKAPASVRGEWYENLEIVSAAARKAGKPMWAFALSVPHSSYP